MDLRLYDLLGREQLNLSDRLLGRTEPYVSFEIPVSSLSSGIYIAALRTSNGSVSGKMVIAK